MQYLVIADYKFKLIRIFIYLLLGTIFALLNLSFIDLGTSLTRLDMMKHFNQGDVLPLGDKIISVVFDVVAWPIILLRNLFVHFTYLFVLLFEVMVGVWLVKSKFKEMEGIRILIGE